MSGVIGFYVMNKRGEYYGPGGWGPEEQARLFTIEEALKMLRAFAPHASLVRVYVQDIIKYHAEATRELAEFVGVNG